METVSDLDSNIDAAKNVAAQQESHRNEPARIVERLKQSLPAGTVVEGYFRKGGTVPKTGAFLLHKGETVIPAQTQTSQPADASQPQAPAQPQDQTQTAPAAQPDDSTQDGNISLPENPAVAGTTNLHRAFSKLNESLVKLADECAVKRSATIPHQDGQPMDQHIADVARVLNTTGGLTANLILATHSKFGPDGGATVAYPAEKLRQTIIPKDDANAKAAIAACRNFISKVEGLIGETPETKLAKSQLALVGKQDGSGMSLADLLVALINIPAASIRAVARAHSEVKHDGRVHAKLTAPKA